MPVTDHPVLGLRDGLERVSRTACVTGAMYDSSHGEALGAALTKCEQLVDKRVGDKDRAGTYYYVTYEVVLDYDGGPGRPMRPSADGEAAQILQQEMQGSGIQQTLSLVKAA